MAKNRLRFIWIFFLVFLRFDVYAQLSGTVTVGSTGATYTSLTGTSGVFNAINNEGLSGNLIVSVVSNTTETGNVALNPINSGFTVTIVPSSATTFTLSGNGIVSNPMVSFDGADGVTIDGAFAGSGRYLVFSNYNSTPANTQSVFNFQNDARANTIKNVVLRSNSSALINAILKFSGTTLSYGNDSNTVTGCKFEGVSPTRYFTAIYNSSTLTGLQRNGNIRITKNEFTKFSAVSTSLIDFSTAGVGDSIAIDSNYIYDDTVHTAALVCINFVNAASMQNSISFNSIGGADINRSGTALRINAGVPFKGIKVTTSSAQPTVVQGNLFSNLACLFSAAQNSLFAIEAIGRTEIFNNIIGGGANSWDTVLNAYDNGLISCSGGITDTMNVYNNLIGNITYRRRANDRTAGINIASGFRVNVYNNIIRNMKANPSGNSTSFNLFGIRTSNNTANSITNIYNNQIYGLQQFNDSLLAVSFAGIIDVNSVATGTTNIYKNKIWDLTTTNTNTGTNAMIINGIQCAGTLGIHNIYDNTIVLAGQNGTEAIVRGIWSGVATTGTINCLYNSVYIAGSATGTTSISAAFARTNSAKVALRNNIFYTERTGGLANPAVYSSVATNWTDTTSDHNLFISATSTGIGLYVSTTNPLTFSAWKDSSKGDKNSLAEISTSIPASTLWLNPAAGDLSLKANVAANWYVFGQGKPNAFPGVSTDIADNARSVSVAGGPTTLGAYELTTPSVLPPQVVNTVTGNGTYNFSLGGKKFAAITVNSPTSGFPFDLSMWHFAGKIPTNAQSGEYAKRYDSLAVTANTPVDLTFDAALSSFANQTYSITTAATTRVVTTAGSSDIWVLQNANGDYTVGTPSVARATALTATGRFALTSFDSPLPVELSLFSAEMKMGHVVLNWITRTELNTAFFEIERSVKGASSWNNIGKVTAYGNSNVVREYGFTDKEKISGSYEYRLKMVDNDGSLEYSKIATVELGIPKVFSVSQNYPNPFNPSTKIEYQLPTEAYVTIHLYATSGELVEELFSGDVPAGYHAIDFQANSSSRHLASGVYLYRVTALEKASGNKMQSTKKMVYMK